MRNNEREGVITLPKGLKPRREVPGRTYTFYVPEELQPVMDRVVKLGKDYHLSVGLMINMMIDSCIETLEKEIPDHRRFTLNGKEIKL